MVLPVELNNNNIFKIRFYQFFLDTLSNQTQLTLTSSTLTLTDPSTCINSAEEKIFPYVDFTKFNMNVKKSKAEGKLPSIIKFFYE